MDLQSPTSKMSKSLDSPQGTVMLLDDPETIARKFKRAETDSLGSVAFDPAVQPGVANLLSILAAATGGDAASLAEDFTQYGPLKAACAEAVSELLAPVRARHAELSSDPAELSRELAAGAAKATVTAEAVLDRVRAAIGLTPRSSA